MFTMMESLEGRQMFSVTSPASTTLAAPDVAVVAAPTDDAVAKSSPTLFRACCTGTHIPATTIIVR